MPARESIGVYDLRQNIRHEPYYELPYQPNLQVTRLEWSLRQTKDDYVLWKIGAPLSISPRNTVKDRILACLKEDTNTHNVPSEEDVQDVWPVDLEGFEVARQINLVLVPLSVHEESLLEREFSPLYVHRGKIYKQRMETISQNDLPGPSAMSNNPQRREEVVNGRPGDEFGLPVTLYSPTLAHIYDEFHLKLSKAPSPVESFVDLAYEFLIIGTTYYDKEETRDEALMAVLDALFERKGLEQLNFGGARLECTWGRSVIYEAKREKGNSGDGTLQGAWGRIHWLRHLRMNNKLPPSNMPCFIISISSMQTEISMAVFTAVLHVDTIYVTDKRGSKFAHNDILELAVVLQMVSEGFKKLEAFYDSLEAPAPHAAKPEKGVELQYLLPLPTPPQFPDLESDPNSMQIDFKSPSMCDSVEILEKLPALYGYTLTPSETTLVHNSQMQRNDMVMAVFIARYTGASNGQLNHDAKVLVKFTRQYNRMAHDFLAGKGLAPNLYGCEKVAGGMTMVVMEFLEGETTALGWRRRHGRDLLPKQVYVDVENATQLLHSKDLVFGDLRAQNIMVRQVDDEWGALLIDFDWCATEGEKYPADIAERQCFLDAGIQRYRAMLKNHDLFLLRQFKADCEE